MILIPVVAIVGEGLAGTERARAQTIQGVFERSDYAALVGATLEKRIAPELDQAGPARRLTVTIDRYGLEYWKDGKYCFAAWGSARVDRADGQPREARFTLAPGGRPGMRQPYCGTVAGFAAADGAMLELALKKSGEELAAWLAPPRRADGAGTWRAGTLRRLVLVPIVVPLPRVCTGRARPWSVPERSLHGELAAKLLREEKGYETHLVASALAPEGREPPEAALHALVARLRDHAGSEPRSAPPEEVRQAVRRLASPVNADGVLLVERAQTCRRAVELAPGLAETAGSDPVFTRYVSAALFDAASGSLSWQAERTDLADVIEKQHLRESAYRSPLEAKVAAEMRYLLRDIAELNPQLLAD